MILIVILFGMLSDSHGMKSNIDTHEIPNQLKEIWRAKLYKCIDASPLVVINKNGRLVS